MPRRTRRSIKARSNYSRENKGCFAAFGSEATNGLYQAGSVIVPAVTTQGIRTVGNWNITVPVTLSSANEYYWALVYVPQGQTANALFATTGSTEGSLYEPNQYVLASGISDANAGPIRVRTNMKRKLHSGDFISLVIGMSNSNVTTFRALVSYSVKYN